MSKKFKNTIASSQITPPDVFFNRRQFISSMGLGLVAAPTLFCTEAEAEVAQSGAGSKLVPPLKREDVFPASQNSKYKIPESIASQLTPRDIAGSHNNFYEFLPGRGGPVWQYTDDFEVDPWKIEVGGECNNPVTLDLDDLFKFEHEERVYHFRCVERWAMNVPWTGFPLRKLIERADPKSSAKFLRFTSARVPAQMPGVRQATNYPWPYREALRIDEAMNGLALLVTGVYGEPLVKQHGSPVRLIVPWKYGYKNPKSIVKIEFLARKPRTFWQIRPHEYGFISNVNPNIPHPRWSQAQSYWLGNEEKFKTPIFNGYQEYVAELYPDEPKTLQEPLRSGQTAR